MAGLRAKIPVIAGMLAALALSACALQNGTDRRELHAPGLNKNGESVDGLIVGHRLMASGEYELALRAYYRAAAEQGLTTDIYSALGSANLRLGRLGQAEDLLRKAVDRDENFAAAWNNLGVVLMESGQFGEAERVFRTAFALDNGQSPQIRANLTLALAKLENPGYDTENNSTFALVRRGSSEYQLLTKH